VITKGLLRIRRLREVPNIKENKLPEFKMAYPETNKALLFTTIGQDLVVVEKEVPSLPANEILVKVHAASINPVDIQLWRSGLVGVVASPKGMGRDFSGTVVAVGSSVRGWADGEDIFGLFFHVVCLQS
jgi:NADPH:quinone reductase-like Zn-dependent oxidoreductase